MIEQPRTIVFIIGCQRSGTTLTGQILGAHPNAVMLDEPDGLYRWFAQWNPDTSLHTPEFSAVLEKATTKYVSPGGRFKTNNAGLTELHPSISHLILKAPNLTYAYNKISRISSETRVIALVRDPRAVVSSMARLVNIHMVMRQIEWIRDTPGLASFVAEDLAHLDDPDLPINLKRALIWKIKSTLAMNFARLGQHYFLVEYENLVQNQNQMTQRLAHHTGLTDHENLRTHNLVLKGKGPGMTDRNRAIDGASLAGWHKELRDQEQQQILTAAGPLAQNYVTKRDTL